MVDVEIGQGSAVGVQAGDRPSVETDVSGWAIVTLRGEQDVFEAERSRAALHDGIAAGRGRVVVNLSDVTFGDSSLLGALVGAAKAARRHSCKVRVVTSDERMRQKLKITGLCQVLRVFPTLADALAGSP
jgi:anti-sigma B factor antagonist